MSNRKLQTKKSSSDDIDSLLDQVEQKYFKSPEAKRLSELAPKDCECTKKQETNWEEVEEILKDFKFEDTNPFGKSKNNSWVRKDVETAPHKITSSKGESSQEKKVEDSFRKCFSLLLGGSYEDLGLSEIGRERPCDKLKCLRCDFQVISFDNYAWDSSTDYLFLRNNMPEFQKLAVKLTKKKGCRAYACQCNHLSVSKITFVQAKPEVRWVCGKHKIRP
ncbi:unnamed protein product [Orchesella dallaii]|uniref:Cilia- and flagella-associated protein 418 n=1 Tax=Orchesella dallaii TaxID=48710 RepID=A0ABP1PKX2_9HEXA